MNQLILACLLGLGAGGLYAILGTGIVVGYKGSGVINFAHGAFATFGAYTFFELWTEGEAYFPWFDVIPGPVDVPVSFSLGGEDGAALGVAIVAGLLMSAFIGVLAHLLVFHPLRRHAAVAKVIGSIGILIYLHAVLAEHYGTRTRIGDGILPETTVVNVFGLGGNIGVDKFILAGLGLLIGLAVSAFYRLTTVGLATRAADENEKGLSLLGYSPSVLALSNWVLAAVLAGLGGILFLGSTSLTPTTFTLFIVPALGAALIGNLSSAVGAAVGGIALGVAQSGSVALTNYDWFPSILPGSAIRQVVPFLVIVVILYRRGERLPSRGSWSDHGQPITEPAQRPLVYASVAVVAAIFIVPDLSARWDLAVVTSLTTMILMLSLVLLVGYLGQVSLVNLSLAGVAAYAMVRFASDGTRESDFVPVAVDGLGLPDPLAFLMGVGAAVVVGLLVAIPALRIRGVHLAVVTLAAALTIEQLIFANETIAGPGARSNTPVPRPEWFGVDLGPQDTETNLFDRWQFTFFVVIMTVLVALAVANLRRGHTGRRFLATRGNERAAEAAGVDVARAKMLGFGISSAIAGVAGGLVAYQRTVLQVTSFDELGGLGSLAFVYLGGITSVAGAFLGSLLVAGGVLPTLLRGGGGGSPSFISSAVAGILLVVVAVAYPDGLAAALNRGARRFGRWVSKPFRSSPRSNVDSRSGVDSRSSLVD